MDDCQNEIDKAIGKYCPSCGQKAELDGRQLHASFCVQYIGTRPADVVVLKEPNFAQLPGFPDYNAYLKQTINDSLTSLGEQAQTLAARMPALLKAAAEAAQQTYPGNKLLEDLAAIRALNDKIEEPTCDVNALRAPIDLTMLRAEALAAQLLKEDEARKRELKMEDYWEVFEDTIGKAIERKWFEVFPPQLLGVDLAKTTDPDGALTPLPIKPAPQRTVSAPRRDFIGALYKPYMSPI